MDNKKINVLVTAVGGRSVGYQVFESLRLFKDNYRIVTSDMDAFSPGLYESDFSYILPGAGSKDYLVRLIRLAKKEKINVVIPGSQQEVEIISQNEKDLLNQGIVPIVNPYNVVKMCFDKLTLYKFLENNNILIPKTVELDLLDKAKKMKFPIVVKPIHNSSGSKNVHVVKDMNELSLLFNQLKKENVQLLVQEYVGDEKEEYTVGIAIGKNGKIIDSIVMKRYLIGLSRGEKRRIDGKDYVLSTGYSQGFFVKQSDVKEYCEYVAKTVGARGPLNIQCRRGEKGVYIFEVHPRFSGSASMRALVGFNEPHYLIRNFLGLEDLNNIPHKLGYAVIRKFANVPVSMEDYGRMKKVM